MIAVPTTTRKTRRLHRPKLRLVPTFTSSMTVTIGGKRVLCCRDPRQAWSYLDYRHKHLGTPTGRRIKGLGTQSDVVAAEYLVATPWGTLRALLWAVIGNPYFEREHDASVVFVAGRQSVGLGEPNPESLFNDYPDTDAERRAARPDWRTVDHLRLAWVRP